MKRTQPTYWYVRQTGTIRGPFDVCRLRSMRQRDRLGPRDEISTDRLQWVMAGTVTEVFPEGLSRLDHDPEAPDWYSMRAGQRHGPITLIALQALAQSGGLSPQDSVWRIGTPNWVLASQVSELSFPPKQSSWQSHTVRFRVGFVLAVVVLIVAPIGLVLGYYHHRVELAREQLREQAEHEKWLVEQKQREADREIQQQALAAAARAEEQRNELLKMLTLGSVVGKPKVDSAACPTCGGKGELRCTYKERRKTYFTYTGRAFEDWECAGGEMRTETWGYVGDNKVKGTKHHTSGTICPRCNGRGFEKCSACNGRG